MTDARTADFRRKLRAGRVALDCTVSPGMFSHERLVLLTVGGQDYAMYVDEMLVDAENVSQSGATKGKLWVSTRVAERDNYVVELPEEGQIITVPKTLVTTPV